MTDEDNALPPIPPKRAATLDDGDRAAGVQTYDYPHDDKQRTRVSIVEAEASVEEAKPAPKKKAAAKKRSAKK